MFSFLMCQNIFYSDENIVKYKLQNIFGTDNCCYVALYVYYMFNIYLQVSIDIITALLKLNVQY